jgi:hypothetical protein
MSYFENYYCGLYLEILVSTTTFVSRSGAAWSNSARARAYLQHRRRAEKFEESGISFFDLYDIVPISNLTGGFIFSVHVPDISKIIGSGRGFMADSRGLSPHFEHMR